MPSSFQTATELLAELRSGSLSAVELMQNTLDRITEVNPQLNAIVSLRDRDALMAEAKVADQVKTRGALHGLPMAVKDLTNVAGIRTTHGSPMMADFIPQTDGLMVARMRQAGAIFIGKTNTPEFGLGSHTFNPVHGATCNPYNLTKSCGGSSGGAAVALASGMLALADGSDMMGSLRNPAGWTNTYGFRPSWGRVPAEPSGDLYLHQLSTCGPMARCPEDIALLLDVMAGPDPRIPLARAAETMMPLPEARPKRIGWLGDWGGAMPMEPGILQQCETALKVFEELGHVVEPVAPPFSAERIWDSWVTLRSFAVAAGLKAHESTKHQLKDTAIWELERGQAMSGTQIQLASEARSDWHRAAVQLFETYDALILPTAQCWPFDVGLDYPRQISGVEMDTYHRWMQVVLPVSLLGLPSLAAPAGFGENGLPIGIQIFGALGQDREILSLGNAYHGATGWPDRKPPTL
ncbi:amidase [Parasedimentitalea huanghaiensis]|uniref:Amidase n=1 Tax=Parasedimentitalea huanghaiensis TaxID=2682100 RepID=A0A6L6WKD3_9RHOB|nr:amidase [Zongyanglinia huanghaiensis]MVO18296.1 amidase [Zongyanglinia huanghaiensis]